MSRERGGGPGEEQQKAQRNERFVSPDGSRRLDRRATLCKYPKPIQWI